MDQLLNVEVDVFQCSPEIISLLFAIVKISNGNYDESIAVITKGKITLLNHQFIKKKCISCSNRKRTCQKVCNQTLFQLYRKTN